MDFYNRVDKASVKNFQLIKENDSLGRIILQFGKIDDNMFNLDFQYPLNPIQAFAIALSSIDSKLFCD